MPTFARLGFLHSLGLCLILSFLIACRKNANQTVDSAYLDPIIPELKYSFARNGSSSVEYYQADVINKTLSYLFSSYLGSAAVYDEKAYKTFSEYYQGEANDVAKALKPTQHIASSKLHSQYRADIIADIQGIIDSATSITGYYRLADNSSSSYSSSSSSSGKPPKPSNRRSTTAKAGVGGQIGTSLVTLGYADASGLVPSEAWQQMLLGAIYLDKILNLHLDEARLNDEKLRARHENLVLVGSGNYTELEHDLDLAYGYYRFFIPLSRAEHLQLLRGSQQLLTNAFVEARQALDKHDYAEMWRRLYYIREMLSKLVAVHAVDQLVGKNTLANLNSENPHFALPFISKAYGLIYALQFARKPDGSLYFSRRRITNILKALLDREHGGLWNVDRLKGNAQVRGSLRHIAELIAEPFGFSPDNLR